MKTRGTVAIDDGAANALADGKSLLPAGVSYVGGAFGRGDPVTIEGPDGRKIGQGLIRYTGTLGYPGRAALIHRDDMAL